MRDFDEAEPAVEVAAGVLAAAGEAGGFPGEAADAVDDQPAGRALVGVAALLAGFLQWQLMTGRFAGDAEFGAGAAPLGPVGGDAAAAGPVVGDEVGEFVEQGAVDFPVAKAGQRGIHLDALLVGPGPAGAGAQPGVPFDPQLPGQLAQAKGVGGSGGAPGQMVIEHGG